MKEIFREFYNNDKVDFGNLKENVLIVFDTNTLLNIYRYSKATRDTFLEALNRVNTNIWIPYQVGLEFNLNRREVMAEMKTKGEGITGNIRKRSTSFVSEVKNELDKYPIKSIDGSAVRKKIHESFTKKVDDLLKDFLDKEFVELEDLIDKKDDKMNQLAEFFDGKVGESYTQEQIKAICDEGSKRYANNVPPGYKDKGKTDVRVYNDLEFESKYGDLIVWKQIIQKAKTDEKSIVVFVTDDHKEDWWYEIKGQKIGARAELKNELRRETGADLILINTNTFLKETSEEKLNADLVETELIIPHWINYPANSNIEVLNNDINKKSASYRVRKIKRAENPIRKQTGSLLVRIDSLIEDISDYEGIEEMLFGKVSTEKSNKLTTLKLKTELLKMKLLEVEGGWRNENTGFVLHELGEVEDEYESLLNGFKLIRKKV